MALLPLQIEPQHDLDVQPVTLNIQSCGCFFVLLPVPDFFEDGLPLPAQAYLKVCSAVSEASLNDMKPSGLPATTDSPAKEAGLQQSGTTVQRTSVLHTQEIVRVSPEFYSALVYQTTLDTCGTSVYAHEGFLGCIFFALVHNLNTLHFSLLIPPQTKWQDNRMSTKQVTITVTQSIHQVDKNGKVKKSLTTYEVMKPMETLKQVAAQNTWEQEEAKEESTGRNSFLSVTLNGTALIVRIMSSVVLNT